MKHLIILILFTSLGMAQVVDTTRNGIIITSGGLKEKFGFSNWDWQPMWVFRGITDETQKYKVIVGKDTMRSPAPYSAMVVLTLLQYYDLYKKDLEVKNDTMQRYWWNGDATFTHQYRQPTFQGFMEFLWKKVKQ